MKPYREKIKVNLIEYYALRAKKGLDRIKNAELKKEIDILETNELLAAGDEIAVKKEIEIAVDKAKKLL